jgi:hypothetical protein
MMILMHKNSKDTEGVFHFGFLMSDFGEESLIRFKAKPFQKFETFGKVLCGER